MTLYSIYNTFRKAVDFVIDIYLRRQNWLILSVSDFTTFTSWEMYRILDSGLGFRVQDHNLVITDYWHQHYISTRWHVRHSTYTSLTMYTVYDRVMGDIAAVPYSYKISEKRGENANTREGLS